MHKIRVFARQLVEGKWYRVPKWDRVFSGPKAEAIMRAEFGGAPESFGHLVLR